MTKTHSLGKGIQFSKKSIHSIGSTIRQVATQSSTSATEFAIPHADAARSSAVENVVIIAIYGDKF